MQKKKSYLKPNRLADVLALIQVLAFDPKAKRSVNGLKSELQGDPKSANSWKDIVFEHPEFFRLNKKIYDEDGDDGNAICLIVRHVNDEVVSSELIKKFFETAIQLHDKQKERADRWKVWLPLLVAIITVLSSFYVQYANNQNQTFLKHYEVELKPKQEGYANYMKAVSKSYFAAQSNNWEQMTQALDQAESFFYVFEPFLSTYDRKIIWEQYQQFTGLCYSVAKSDSLRNNPMKATDSFMWYKTFFRTNLYEALFSYEKQKASRKE